jgi:hypothetical protein
VRGTGFTSGQAVDIVDFNDGTGGQQIMGVRVGQATVSTDGTFATEIQLASCGPAAPQGMTITIKVFPQGSAQTPADVLASAIFTVGTAMPGLPNTGGGAPTAPKQEWILVCGVAVSVVYALRSLRSARGR